MKSLIITAMLLFPILGFSQLGVSFHQSNLPFFGVNYQFKSKFRAELRLGVDNYIENTSVEAVVTYDFIKNEDYEFYGGLGLRGSNENGGAVIPFGLNVYPLNVKKFGFHIEIAPIIEEDAILRGSWGIRYKF